MARLNLSYYEPSDDFYYTETSDIVPEFRELFLAFYEDVINKLNFLGQSYTVETGEGRFPFHQTMRLYNISPSQVLTNFDPGTNYSFTVSTQNIEKTFSTDGASLRTYQNIINFIQSEVDVTVSYLPAKGSTDHRLRIQSNTTAIVLESGEDSTSLFRTPSQVSITEFANTSLGVSDTELTDGEKAEITINLTPHDGNQILTNAPNDSTVVFEFKQGANKKLSVRGQDAQTYQQLADTINDSFDSVQAFFRMDGSYKNQILIAFTIPEDEEPSKYDYISEGIKVQPTITNFVPLAESGEVIHLLEDPIVGGPNLLTVVSFSRRGNGNGWGSFIPILLTSNDSKVAISLDDNQLPTLEQIADKAPKESGISISDVAGRAGENIPDSSTSAVEIGNSLKESVLSKIDEYKGLVSGDIPPIDIEGGIGSAISSIGASGFAEGALNSDGSVADESLLTPAQKSILIPQPTKFSN